MTTVLPNGELQSNPRIAYNKGYEKGRADQKKEDNEFFNFEGAWELEKQKIKAEAIEEVIKTLAKSEDTILSDKQYYALMELMELKGAEE